MGISEFDLDGEGLEVPPGATPLDFLSAIYRDSGQPMHRRMKAAIEAAPFVHPKLAVALTVDGNDFAARLEKALERSSKVAMRPVIEAAPVVNHKPPPMVPDRRYRRPA
jgi:hypothetical protein